MARLRMIFLACIAMVTLCHDRRALAHQGHSHESDQGLSPETFSPPTSSPDSGERTPDAGPPSAPFPRRSLSGPSVEAFGAFSQTVKVHIDGQQLVVESDGLPGHDMMVGIRAWQRQVPLPQPFAGENAWRLPLRPRPAAKPISVRSEPLRGAIALAVNGVPIFCALNDRSEDTFLAGELDQWGGHCGRGDDYHYHLAPVHLETLVGAGNPIAFALDGYPILGFADPDGSVPEDLDPLNGHTHDGHYHYHATKSFPYLNGGLHGVVTLRGDQIDQPRNSPVRQAQSPLPGARVTGFRRTGDRFDVEYRVSGKEAHVKYKLAEEGRVEFTFVDPSGKLSTQVYQRGQAGGAASRSYRWQAGIASGIVGLGIVAASVLLRRRHWNRRRLGTSPST